MDKAQIAAYDAYGSCQDHPWQLRLDTAMLTDGERSAKDMSTLIKRHVNAQPKTRQRPARDTPTLSKKSLQYPASPAPVHVSITLQQQEPLHAPDYQEPPLDVLA
jgi:hypothetical protein